MNRPNTLNKRLLILTDSGLARLEAAIFNTLGDDYTYQQLLDLAIEHDLNDTDTISKILKREKPVLRKSLNGLFKAVSLQLQDSDYTYFQPDKTPDSSRPNRPTLRQLPYCSLPIQPNEFIGRKTELQKLLQYISLKYRAPIITVDGIGGVGKTALVVEAAYQSWECKHGIPTDAQKFDAIFDAIIFTSAKENYLYPTGIVPRPQRQNTLRDIFRAIASTLDDQSITQSAPEDQLNRVYQSLSRQKTLLIVDNLETITEKDEVLGFLSDLPSSTKAVITTREQVIMYASMRVDCLPEDDSLRLIQQQATEKDITISHEQSRGIYQRFGGVPIALIYIIGQLASGYSLETILDESTPLPEDIARFCFDGSVQPLRGKIAHKLLMSLAIFSESAVWDALTEVAGIKTDPINAKKGLARLQQLSLVRQQEGQYRMLSLTREYALAELAADADFEKAAREIWVKWYQDFVQKYGQEEWAEWHIQYDRLQEEGGNILAVLHWCASQELYEDVKHLWENLRTYSHIYGYWEDRLFWMEWLIQASERRGDWATAVFAMSQKGWTLILIGQLKAAEEILLQAWSLHDYASLFSQSLLTNYLAQLYLEKKEYDRSGHWLNVEEELLKQSELDEVYYIRHKIAHDFYRARIEYDTDNYAHAKIIYQQLLAQSQEINWQRAIYYMQGEIAKIEIKEGNFHQAENLLRTALVVAERNRDKRPVFLYQKTFAELEKNRGNIELSRDWATQALNGFNLLGMTREAEEISSFLNSLD